MSFPAVAQRELLLVARDRRTYRSRVWAALIVMLMSLGMLYAGFGGFVSAASAGRDLFLMVSWAAGAYVLLDGVILTADCLSREKREGTLGLLFLTDLNGYDVVLGKLVSRTAGSAYCLMAALPALGLTVFLGGVTGEESLCMSAALLNGLFFSTCWGLLCSALCRRETRALGLGVFGLLLMAVLLPGLGWALSVHAQTVVINPAFLISSPAGAFLHSLDLGNTGGRLSSSFGQSLVCTHLLAWGFLLAASLVLPRSWTEPAMHSSSGSQRTTGQPRSSDRGTTRVQAQQRHLRLPVVWSRTTRSGFGQGYGFWPVFVALAGGWGIGWACMGSEWLAWPSVTMAALVLHLTLMCFVTFLACRGPGDDRRSGALEILLTTPLGEDVYLSGRMLSLKVRLIWPLLLVLMADVGLWLTGCWAAGAVIWEAFGWGAVFAALSVKLVIDLYALIWVGLWQGLRSGSTGQALRKTLTCLLLLKWILLFGLIALIGLLTQGRGFQSAAGGSLVAFGYVAFHFMSTLHFTALAKSELADDLRGLVLGQLEASRPAPVGQKTRRFQRGESVDAYQKQQQPPT